MPPKPSVLNLHPIDMLLLEHDTVSTDSVDDTFISQLNSVNRRLDEFQRELRRTKGEVEDDALGASPFTPEIQDKLVPLNFRLPALEAYNGGSDPMEHVAAFRAQMAIYGTSDA